MPGANYRCGPVCIACRHSLDSPYARPSRLACGLKRGGRPPEDAEDWDAWVGEEMVRNHMTCDSFEEDE